jgi:hypothetical protein
MRGFFQGVALLALAGGCRQGFDLIDAVDASTDGELQDAPIDAPIMPCVARWLASQIMVTPRALSNLNTPGPQYSPFIDVAGTTLYFSAPGTDPANLDLFKATRATDFADVTLVEDLSSPATDGSIILSVDGLVATVATEREGGMFPGRDLWEATRNSAADTFSGFTTAPFVNVNTAGNELEFWISHDRLRIYVSADISGEQHITLASRETSSEPFGVPVVISEIDSPAPQCCLSLSGDERVIVFGSQRSGTIQLYYATRTSRTDPFSPPRAVPTEIPPSGFDLHAALTSDACTLYFSSTRPGAGSFDLWMSEL